METLAKPTILVVEDDKDDVFLLEHASKITGFPGSLTFAENGQQAVEWLENRQAQPPAAHDLPDLILLDLNMPVMGGLDFLRWLRSKSEFQKLPVLIFTTSQDPRDVESSYNLGANAYLVKPNSPTELSRMFRAAQNFWLADHRGQKAV